MFEHLLERLQSQVGLKKPDPQPFSEDHFKRVARNVVKAIMPEGSSLIKLLGSKGYHNHIGLAENLRNYPIEMQERIFVGICGTEGMNLPNGEKLGEYLAELNVINWFLPSREPDRNFLQEQVNAYLSALMLNPLPISIIEDRWDRVYRDIEVVRPFLWRDQTGRGAVSLMRDVAAEATLGKPVDLAYELGTSIASNGAQRSIWAFNAQMGLREQDDYRMVNHAQSNIRIESGLAAEWIIIEDLMQERGYRGNPYLHLVEMYKAGVWPIGAIRGTEFVIFTPPVQKAT